MTAWIVAQSLPHSHFADNLAFNSGFRLIGGKLSGESEARLLAKERIFDGWMSIVSALYIT